VVALTALTATAAPAMAVTPPTSGNPRTVTGSVRHAAAATLAPAITVATSVAPSSFSGVGQTLGYSYLVTNSGDAPLTNVVVHDALAGVSAVTCAATELLPGGISTCHATYVTTQADVDRGRVVNTAVANGTPPSGPPVTSAPAHSSASSTLPPPTGSISIVGPSESPVFSIPVRGIPSHLAIAFVVTNTGAAPLREISVLEATPPGTQLSCPAQELAPGASMNCNSLRRCLRTPAGERCVTFRGVRWGCTRRITAR